MRPSFNVDLLLRAYQEGVFPMAHPEWDNQILWYAPDPRAVLPLPEFHVSKNLRKLVRRETFSVTTDQAFKAVMEGCADRDSTWISDDIIQVYTDLHELGAAHSVECWLEGELVGGLYGVALGGAYFGESMFHRTTDASKVALVHLVRHLRRRGYELLDTQYTTPHLERFGVTEVPRARYESLLRRVLHVPASWGPPGPIPA